MYKTSIMFLAALGGFFTNHAFAQRPLPVPASLLVHPEFDSTPGHVTLITVTNTNLDPMNGPIRVEFVYISADDCLEFNRSEQLTPGDTLTALSTFHNPVMERGYLYMFAKSVSTGAPIAFNHLISAVTVVDGLSTLDYDVDPFVFRAVGAEGTPTDLDGDGRQDLDGIEYEQCPDRILIPRFHGQPAPGPVPPGAAQSELVLLNLTGAVQFVAVVEFLINNDNEELFSAQFTFECWSKTALSDINGVFQNDFLQVATTHDPNEPIGAPGIENGWMSIDGRIAFSTVCSAPDPAILGLLIEKVGGSNATASLPFMQGRQANGSLIEFGIFVDNCLVADDAKPARRSKQAP